MRYVWLLACIFLATGAWSVPLPDIQALEREFTTELKQRELAPKFAGMRAYFGDRLDACAGTKTFSDKTGNCRLSWFDWMMRHPLESAGAADEFTRTLHEAAGQPDAAARVVAIAGPKLDAGTPEGFVPDLPFVSSEAMLLKAWSDTILATRDAQAKALAPLTPTEREELIAKLYPQTTLKAEAPYFAEKPDGRRVSDLLEKMDRRALLNAAASLSYLAYRGRFNLFTSVATRQTRDKAQSAVATPAGTILFGGKGDDTYRLDEMPGVCMVVDAGGNDTYLEGTVSPARPVLVIIDLGGNDRYEGKNPGIQGGAVLGASLLVDAAGDDAYMASNLAQGSALGGVGMLFDLAGNDRYLGDKRAQGQAVGGLGVLIDRAGDDDYRAALLSQGVGGPLGFGLLDDVAGADHYYAGGKYADNYDDSPGYNGWSQGVGVGPRGTANGGIGVLLDGGGDDTYEADYFSHGGGYWFALGFARDFGGNDQRVGSTRTAWDGSPRKETRFLRYGNGFGVHYAAGYLFDDAGDDVYIADHAGVGFTWDIGITVLVDRDGNDRYQAGSGVGACYNTGLMLFLDARGNDTYISGNIGAAGAQSDYHPDDARAFNFTFLLDLLGEDTYPEGMKNGAVSEHGWAGGLVLDR